MVNVVVVPVKVRVLTPFNTRSIMSKFVLTVVPQAPACSPDPGFSMPEFVVNVLAIYAPLFVHVSDDVPAFISVQLSPV